MTRLSSIALEPTWNRRWPSAAWLASVLVVGACGPNPGAGGRIAPADSAAVSQPPRAAKQTDGKTAEAAGPLADGTTVPVALFDGRTLNGWRVVDEAEFESHGKVYVKDGAIILKEGGPQTGISWTGDLPRDHYEVKLEAMRVDGSDFFCGLTFPVAHEQCTLILGGWGGCLVGLSNVDGQHAAENETTTGVTFENGRWYRIELRVSAAGIEAWIDDQQQIDLDRSGKRFSIWAEQDPVAPFGVATWYTSGALRNITMRRLPPSPPPATSTSTP